MSNREIRVPLKGMSQTEAELRERILNDNVVISILKSEVDDKQKIIDELTAKITVLKQKLKDAKHLIV